MARAVRSGVPVALYYPEAVVFQLMPEIEIEETSRLYNELHLDRTLEFAEANKSLIS